MIALDTEGDDEATMVGTGAGVSMAAMLDEDLSAQPALEMGMGGPLAARRCWAGSRARLAEGATLMQPAALLEPPYTTWQIVGLAICTVLSDALRHDDLRPRAEHVERAVRRALLDQQRTDGLHPRVDRRKVSCQLSAIRRRLCFSITSGRSLDPVMLKHNLRSSGLRSSALARCLKPRT